LVETLNQQNFALPPMLAGVVTKTQNEWRAKDGTRRLWAKDATLWTGHGEEKWLGWLDNIDHELQDADTLAKFAGDLAGGRFTHALLLGMGGSSLGPEVLARSLGSVDRHPKLHVLDSTDPEQVRRFERGIDIAHTLFIVASKSGTTLEPNVLLDYFYARASAVIGGNAGQNFVAITDPGSQLQAAAEQKGFFRIFFGIPSIGGRYSVLSKFGLVPLAAMGQEGRGFLAAAGAMMRACRNEDAATNPGVALGLAIGALARLGRDKLTIMASPSITSFGAWVEQLVAESTGKNHKGVIPIADEPIGHPSVYGTDRFFVYLRDSGRPDAGQDAAVEALERAGQPIARIAADSARSLAQEFARFEIATAVAGAVLDINPFDQPDVEASKVATREMTATFERTGTLPEETAVCQQDGLTLYTDARNAGVLRTRGASATLQSWLKAHFDSLGAGDYFALLCYLDADQTRLEVLQRLRAAIRDSKGVATCLQFGPRFLHSTGQAYKGGPNTGVFLQITAQAADDVVIPGRAASFGIIEAAQAAGDFRVLTDRGRRALRVHVGRDVTAGIAALSAAVRTALQ
jgi:transaldolase/glucose-6-phosphate isomerase